ncbi:MAG: RNB domain-containing ribonuclease [Demequinaceae bacterium]|nr:RNB domain-containing ribonuclease [Demequinaceae bacterium]
MHIRRQLARPRLTELEPYFQHIRERAGIQEGYAPGVYFEAEHARMDAEHDHVPGERADATDLPLVTIDPEGALDLDQAVHIERRGDGHRVFYAIADVGAHVTPDGELDADTRSRGQTVYCPDRRIGLHPPVMSEGYASLLPGQRTKAVLWTLDLDGKGDLSEVDLTRVWVRSRHQYSYAELASSPPSAASGLVSLLGEVGERRRTLARSRGAVTLPKPSQAVGVEEGRLVLRFRAARGIEDDNAQVSLLTGEAAARLMLEGGIGVLRTLPPAEDKALRRLRHQAVALGIEWSDHESYPDVLARLDLDSPTTAAFLTYATALFRGAAWVPFDDSDPDLPRPEVVSHGALGVPYAHVTAPLRRLVDRFATEACLAIREGRATPKWVRSALPSLGEAMARSDNASSRVDRACIDAVEAALLSGQIGEEFTGVGLDDDTIQLAEPAIVAKCLGAVEVGRSQRIGLVSAELEKGPLFETLPEA